MTITIANVSQSDHTDWLTLIRGYDSTIPDPNIAWERLFKSDSNHTCLLATNDGKAVGLLHYYLHDILFNREPVCYVAALYVDPAARRQGIARQLLETVYERAKENVWARIYWVTERDNYIAQALYDQIAKSDYIRYHFDFLPWV